MPTNTNRRRFIQLAGTGTALSIAGCNALQSDGTPTDGAATDDGSGGEVSGNATVTLQLQLGQEAQQQLQRQQLQIQSQIRSGELSQSEGQSQIRETQAELYGDAIDSFQSEIDGNANLTVEDSVESFGVLLVSGTPEALIGALNRDSVGSLYGESTFEQARAQAQQGTQTPSGGAGGTTTEEPTGTPSE
jgi:carbon monoxide dehydrogenase subunit G